VRTVKELLDTAPQGMMEQITMSVSGLPGVKDCHQVRLRSSGGQTFVDVHVVVDGDQSLESAHALTEVIETRIRDLIPGADVTVHPEPMERIPDEPAAD